ncbi:serine kinase [Emticicia sp. BO119]|uniref:serine kinase n=1 Tax=Emticicia sp. BO119 TaxID=2757768 RepID=UPI0015F04674|nr:serine kinase [Emticicia sp. BO119]MBA4848793.1 serine kinase [Emticicia sp. BO119]
MNYYFAYGLSIATDISFPELFVIPFTAAPDVSVSIGKVPAHLLEKTKDHPLNIFISPTEYLLPLGTIAHYYAANGNEVIIEPLPDADEKSIRLFFLSNAMAAILYQRRLVPMHASAIYTNDGIVLFMGDSGVGKSTTVATLQAKGHRIFSDDICVPVQEDGILKAFAAYPMMKLWKDTFEKVDLGNYNEENRIRPELEKYHKSFAESFDIQSQPIKCIFIIEKDSSLNTDLVRFVSIQGIEAFKHLQYYAYRLFYIEEMGLKKLYFELLSKLSGQIPVVLVSRPADNTTFYNLTDTIESLIDKLSIESN